MIGISRGLALACFVGLSAALPNIALGKKATLSSVGWGGVASRAVDGNKNGNYDGGSVAHTATSSGNNWLEIDLGEVYEVTSVRVVGRDSFFPRYVGQKTSVSENPGGKNAVLLGEIKSIPKTQVNELYAAPGGKVLARYIRIEARDQHLMIAEVEAHGELLVLGTSSVSVDGETLSSRKVEEEMEGGGAGACCSESYQNGAGEGTKLSKFPAFAKETGVFLSAVGRQAGKHVAGNTEKLAKGGAVINLSCGADSTNGCSFFLSLRKQCNRCEEKTNGGLPKLLVESGDWTVGSCAPKISLRGEDEFEMVTFQRTVGAGETVELPATTGALQHFAIFQTGRVVSDWCPKSSGSLPVQAAADAKSAKSAVEEGEEEENQCKCLPAATPLGCIVSLDKKGSVFCLKAGQSSGYSLPGWIRGANVEVRADIGTRVVLCDYDNLSYNRLATFIGSQSTNALKGVVAKNGKTLNFNKPHSMRVESDSSPLGCIVSLSTGAKYCLPKGKRCGYALPGWIWNHEVRVETTGDAKVQLCDWANLSYNRLAVFSGNVANKDLEGVKARNGATIDFSHPRSMRVY